MNVVHRARRRSWLLATGLVVAATMPIGVRYVGFGAGVTTDWPLTWLAVAAVLASSIAVAPVPSPWGVRPRVLLVTGLWFFWALVCALSSGRVFSAMLGMPGSMLGWCVLAMSALLAAASARVAGELRTILPVVAPAIVLSQITLVVLELRGGLAPSGSLSNSTYMAEIVVLLLPSVFYARHRVNSLWARVALMTIVLTALCALIVAEARSGVALVGAWLVIAGGIRFAERLRRRPSPDRRAAVLAMAVMGVLVGAGVFGLLTGSRQAVQAWIVDRSRFWVPSVHAVSEHPVFGYGPDGFQPAVWRIAPAAAVESRPDFGQLAADPHNLLLWVAISTGLVGLALLVWATVEVVGAGRSAFRHDRLSSAPLLIGSLMYVLSALSAPAALQTLPLATVVIGASIATPSGGASARQRHSGLRRVAVAASLVPLAVALLASGTRLWLTPGATMADGTPRAAIAARFWRVDPFLHYRASVDLRNEGKGESRQDALSHAVEHAVTAAALEPGNAVYATELARALAASGASPDRVREAYNRAVAYFPRSPSANAAYAEYLIEQGVLADAAVRIGALRGMDDSLEAARAKWRFFDAIGDQQGAAAYRKLYEALADEARSHPLMP